MLSACLQEATADVEENDVAADAKGKGKMSAKQRSGKAATKQDAKDDTTADPNGNAGEGPSNPAAAVAAAAAGSSDDDESDEESEGISDSKLPPEVRQQQEGECGPVHDALGNSMLEAEVCRG